MHGATPEDLRETVVLAMMVRAASVKNFVKAVAPELLADDAP